MKPTFVLGNQHEYSLFSYSKDPKIPSFFIIFFLNNEIAFKIEVKGDFQFEYLEELFYRSKVGRYLHRIYNFYFNDNIIRPKQRLQRIGFSYEKLNYIEIKEIGIQTKSCK